MHQNVVIIYGHKDKQTHHKDAIILHVLCKLCSKLTCDNGDFSRTNLWTCIPTMMKMGRPCPSRINDTRHDGRIFTLKKTGVRSYDKCISKATGQEVIMEAIFNWRASHSVTFQLHGVAVWGEE